jgi:homogentisate 1,2-dioxygenase
VVADRPSPLYRNAIGDECLYVEDGAARLESSFGVLELTAGDYAIIPTSVIYRVVPAGSVRLLIIESTGQIGPPKRYL